MNGDAVPAISDAWEDAVREETKRAKEEAGAAVAAACDAIKGDVPIPEEVRCLISPLSRALPRHPYPYRPLCSLRSAVVRAGPAPAVERGSVARRRSLPRPPPRPQQGV